MLRRRSPDRRRRPSCSGWGWPRRARTRAHPRPARPRHPGAAAAADRPRAADPGLPTDLLLPQFLGAPATAQPIPHPPVPQLPLLSANGTNSMHNDAYASDAYEVSGPLGRNLR